MVATTVAPAEHELRPLDPHHGPPVDPPPAMPGEAAPPPRKRRRIWRFLLRLLLILGALTFLWLLVTTPFARALDPIAHPSFTLLSADGRPIARRGAIIDRAVKVSELPRHVPLAFVAIEDHRFFRHGGVDPQGIARAAVRNLFAGGVREGGSTITQQLAKLTGLSSERTAIRKIREMLLAVWLEVRLSKEEILARYLSNAYFGDNVYGLRAASHHYFNRSPDKLTVGQAALLAGLVKAPTRLAPTRNLPAARARAALVLDSMVRYELLDKNQAAAGASLRLSLGPARTLPSGTYFADWVLAGLDSETRGPVTVETTLDRRLQRIAVETVQRARLRGAQVAIVAMRPDGRVVAMLGGRNYAQSPFNRVSQARRQPGSTFKLFVYLAALRAGMTPESRIQDLPITVDGWSPTNIDGRYRGSITLREAFARSANAATVRLSERLGRSAVIETARDLGVTAGVQSHPSLPLGTAGVSLLEMTAAYAAVASGRYPVRPRGVPEVPEESWVDWLRSRSGTIDDESVRPMMLDLLWSAANEGTGRAAALSVPSFGKTGTTQDHRDAIFIGFAGDLVTGVWIGHDDNRPLRGVTGGGLPAEIWRDFMARSLRVRAAAPRVAAPPPVKEPDLVDQIVEYWENFFE